MVDTAFMFQLQVKSLHYSFQPIQNVVFFAHSTVLIYGIVSEAYIGNFPTKSYTLAKNIIL